MLKSVPFWYYCLKTGENQLAEVGKFCLDPLRGSLIRANINTGAGQKN